MLAMPLAPTGWRPILLLREGAPARACHQLSQTTRRRGGRRRESSRGLVVAGGNGTELLELGEEVLDQVARLVEVFVEVARRLAGWSRWDHRRLAGFSERLEHALVGVERFVGNERLGFKRGSRASAPARSCS